MRALLSLLLLAAAALAQPLPDRDRDCLPDLFETAHFRTDPDRADTDGDGVPDGAEVARFSLPGNPKISGQGAGARWLASADDRTLLVGLLLHAPEGFEGVRLRARLVIGDSPSPASTYDLTLALPAARVLVSGDLKTALVCWELPAGVLSASWAFGGGFEIGARRVSGAATLSPGADGPRLLEPRGERWQIRRVHRIRPFAGGADRICVQTLENVGSEPGPVKIVVDEGCEEEPSECVSDCGLMIGRIVILLDQIW
jgi:hypothetical protein